MQASPAKQSLITVFLAAAAGLESVENSDGTRSGYSGTSGLERVAKTHFLGSIQGEMGFWQGKQLNKRFFQFFLPCLLNFQSCYFIETLKNLQMQKKMSKKRKKNYYIFSIQLIFSGSQVHNRKRQDISGNWLHHLSENK